ncbi:CaiB/BaiF CoA transferase family protein [Roseococcus sp.]|uniref:CaiB/BaiF CoA transferase family protein n=1 Tax=Roseococcus sp. TaxID=2109646 RepID=UPI003BAACBB1
MPNKAQAPQGEAAGKPLPLAGIRVLEFCHVIMGPSCGLVLADLGAEVIKIEPVEGDRTRRLSGFAAGFFATFNRNKRCLAVDLKAPEGRAVIARLLENTDILIENFAPGTMERLGFGYEELAAKHPGLIYGALKGFLSGPYEKRPALDEIVQFMSGLAYMTGPPGQPLRAGASVCDILGGVLGVVGILAALQERGRTGKGQLVKSALFESAGFLMASHMAGEVVTGRPMPPMPDRQGAWAIYETFATSDDRQIFLGITSDQHWKRFCDSFGLDALRDDPKLKTNEDRVAARPMLKKVIADLMLQRTHDELAEIFERASIPFAPVARPGDLPDDPQLNAHGRMLNVEIGDGRVVKLPRLPIEMGDHDTGLRSQPGRIGQDTLAILAELGIPGEESTVLVERGIVGGA